MVRNANKIGFRPREALVDLIIGKKQLKSRGKTLSQFESEFFTERNRVKRMKKLQAFRKAREEKEMLEKGLKKYNIKQLEKIAFKRRK